MSVLEEHRHALLAETADGLGPSAAVSAEFLALYYRDVLTDDLVERQPEDLRGVVLSHWSLARRRQRGEVLVRSFTPTVEAHGWSTGGTVVQVVCDDRPFIVDSLMAELGQQGLEIRLLVHPQPRVARDEDGTLVGPDPDGIPESWVHVEVERLTDPEAIARLVARIERVLADVAAAVTDWKSMTDRAAAIAAALREGPDAVPAGEREEAADLLEWLVDDHFLFLGYRQYSFTDAPTGGLLEQMPGTGLGLLRKEGGTPSRRLTGVIAEKAREPRVLIVSKANTRSTVHRASYMDYVGIKTFGPDGVVNGEHRFLGLFTSLAMHAPLSDIPVVRTKLARVLEISGYPADTHSGRDVRSVLESYPRDEVFQADADFLADVARNIVAVRFRGQTQLFARADDYGRFLSCTVLMPRERYNTAVRVRVQEILMRALQGSGVEYSTRVSDAMPAMVYYVVRRDAALANAPVNLDELEEWLRDAVRTWEGEWAQAMEAEFGDVEGSRLVERWGPGLDEAYKATHRPRAAAVDIRFLQAVPLGGIMASLYQEQGAPDGERRLRLYCGRELALTEVLPVLLDFGLRVSDERPYTVRAADGPTGYILDFGVSAESEDYWDRCGGTDGRFVDALHAVWQGRAESDRLNQLVGTVGLSWQQVVVLRMLTAYLRQTTHYSKTTLMDALTHNAAIADDVVAVFEARFRPDVDGGREELTQRAADLVDAGLEAVPSLDHDRVIRALVHVIRAGVRTSFYQPGPDGDTVPPETIAFKLEPGKVPHLAPPRPRFEVWVYGTQLEGVHFRFGRVARGGLRWSDRPDDFRTEVLGLVKAQMVKNAVIVPTGAKGCFFPKRLPDPQRDRRAWLARGEDAYRRFVAALLSVTDNLVGGEVVPPRDVVRHDADDTYLVVAADKGTASFSDVANEVSLAHGYWLGDAFASGGATGYDHKEMGITARGAWESVRRHFLELGVDPDHEDITVVGIGDMSGDVFGNGMLQSKHIRLVAAFDHRHVFVDPNPDAATSYEERRRLFHLPTSSWADYSAELISPGGGVFPRDAKAVAVTAEMRAVLPLGEADEVTPAELVRAVLRADVDLLWNGGIGTYVKASTEQDAEIGDRANNGVRINGDELRCRVFAEGGNLGASQRGRVEAAQHGVHINTDAIDNSAGVDSSDHEVNIKILLDKVVAEGRLTGRQRNDLLASMTDEVARRVLRTNYEQNILLANARHLGPAMVRAHGRLMDWLEKRGALERSLESLPTHAQLGQRAKDGHGLTSPEFAVLIAYAKLAMKEALLASDVPDDPWFERELVEYFPAPLHEFADAIARHPLRREIIATRIANSLVNRGGISFAHRAMEETGASMADVARAYVVAREVFDQKSYVRAVEELDGRVDAALQSELFIEFRQLLERAVWHLLRREPPLGAIADELDRYREPVARLLADPSAQFSDEGRRRFLEHVEERERQGAPRELAEQSGTLADSSSRLAIVELAAGFDADVVEVARAHHQLSEVIRMDELLGLLDAVPNESRWDAVAKSSVRHDLYELAIALTADALAAGGDESSSEKVDRWAQRHDGTLGEIRALVDELRSEPSVGLSHSWVLLQELERLREDT
ncbi:NAD-glutamate dehydrogenase [Tessaracoccus oleiagri]|uniref:Glutamate dehydrogenase n=1 Tax=Tessaracoccus oleiagri TaxID=686624 RepID=A0A1G9JX29_9ACTN|nr:NAD-glutamate dehydrogenase [Tessaracoccus oleiagri]SDL42041.1 glutamate dehydrogenase [Tessaracoccus oleiagri]